MSRDLDLDDVASVSPTATDELSSLRQQLATVTKERDDHLKREVMLRDALDIVSKCSVVEDCRLIAVNALATTEPKEQEK